MLKGIKCSFSKRNSASRKRQGRLTKSSKVWRLGHGCCQLVQEGSVLCEVRSLCGVGVESRQVRKCRRCIVKAATRVLRLDACKRELSKLFIFMLALR